MFNFQSPYSWGELCQYSSWGELSIEILKKEKESLKCIRLRIKEIKDFYTELVIALYLF